LNGSLVLVARAGFFIPNGKPDRTHRDATLLHLLGAGAGGADVMVIPGHWRVAVVTLHNAASVPSGNFFVTVKIA
jgi:hypothetical protein